VSEFTLKRSLKGEGNYQKPAEKIKNALISKAVSKYKKKILQIFQM
jgi:hypothetical protein